MKTALLKRLYHNRSHDQNVNRLAHMKEQDRKAAFNTIVAQWAFSLERYAIRSHDFLAIPKMSYDHHGDSEGVSWKIRVECSDLVVRISHGYDSRIPHIRCGLSIPGTQLYREYDTDNLVVTAPTVESLAETIKLADMLVATFPGHAVCDWWPNERETYAGWIASGQPEWRKGIAPHWPTTNTPQA